MIISHKYKFIFVKTKKTAGTSIEIALSEFCDDEDIITPITPEDELTRKSLGFRGPQNCNVPLKYYGKSDWLRLALRGNVKQFYNHATVQFIKQSVSQDIWNSYFKFCFERNPFDKAISRYYWSTDKIGDRPDIADYLEAASPSLISSWDIYANDGQVLVDFVGRYESIESDLAAVREKIGLPKELTLVNAKGGYRKDRRHYSNVLNARARTRIEQVCAMEIAKFSYGWTSNIERVGHFARTNECGMIP